MFCIKEGRALRRHLAIAAAALAASASVAGCVSPQHSLNRDWSDANRSFKAAQTADPEAKYVRELNPASNGIRAADASWRYNRGEVTEPAAMTTSTSLGAAPAAPSGSGGSRPSSR